MGNFNLYKLIFIALSICYLLFPNNNQTLDAWVYAGNVRYGTDIFKAHHLLYNWLMYYLKSFLLFRSVDTITFMQFVNGIFALFSLWFLYRILLVLHDDKRKSLAWTLFVGCSFATIRYGTENETHIIPVFFSIVASYFFLLYIRHQADIKFLFISGLFASISCLFHQLHFFWWLALLIGILLLSKPKKIKDFIFFTLPALIVPIIYISVLCFSEGEELTLNNLFSFIFEYYHSENADVKIDSLNFILTPISFFRSFFQIHGNIINFFLAKSIMSLLCIAFFVFCIYKFIFPPDFRFSFNRKNTFVNIHCIAFLLHFAFSFYSKGNAEFMVMLPFLFSICLSYWLSVSEIKLLYLSIAMLIWNMTFAILPNHFYNFQNNQKLIEIIESNPEKRFILEDRNKIVAQYSYVYGEDISDRIFSTKDIIDNKQTGVFYTDVLSKVKPYSRASIVSKNSTEFDYFRIKKITEIQSFYGGYTIDEIFVTECTNY